jgi:hypothetical protein
MADTSESAEEREEQYPDGIYTDAEKRRWDLSKKHAEALGLDPASTWTATHSLYGSDIPTDTPSPSDG